MEKNRPIAVFDSGLGGVSVLQKLIRLLPRENYIYFGDSQNAPYGPKGSAEVRALTCLSVETLIKKQAKALVLACNSATSVAVDLLRDKYPDLPIIGIEPAIKPAVESLPEGRVLVMATAMTLREEKFARLLERYGQETHFLPLAAPGIVELVERGVVAGPELETYLNELLAPYVQDPVDGLVLGCTHFPLVQDKIVAALGYEPLVFDGAAGTAREAARQLAAAELLNDGETPGQVEFLNSNPDPALPEICRRLLQG